MTKSLWCGLFTCFLCSACYLSAQNISFEWLQKYDGQSNTLSPEGSSDFLVIDRFKNVYQLLEFQQWIRLADTAYYEPNNVVGQCLVKYDEAGKMLWSRKIVGKGENANVIYWGKISSLQLTTDGNVLIGGEFSSDYLHLGIGDTLKSGCDECTTIFMAAYSAQGDLIWAEQYRAKGGEEIDTSETVAFNTIMAGSNRNHKLLSFLAYADTLTMGGENLSYLAPALAIVELDENNGYIRDERLTIEGEGLFYPSRLVPQKNDAFLLFGNVDPNVSLSNSNGFGFESLPAINPLANSFLLIQFNQLGEPQYAKELYGEYLAAQLVADSSGNTYLFGHFDQFLSWGGNTVWNAAGENIGFIFKLDANGEISWQKIYPNASVEVYLHNNPACITPEGGFLAPLAIITPSEIESTIFEGHEVFPSYYDYASALVHFNPSGALDTFVDLYSSEGLLFALSLNYDPNGHLYGVFQTAGMDTLNIGAYTMPVTEQTSEILACFRLSTLAPGLNVPKLPTAVDKTTANLRIIRTYPNPTEDKITVEWAPHAEPAQLLLRNGNGQTLQAFSMAPYASQQSLDLRLLPRGWYIVEWKSGGKRELLRVLKH
ncbi:T9SS type A sorting domain-containing protein [Haliscomenobacter hydrossis]|uniref:Secretion system C-terminal sorting domain-containing protein n=1 Tax=Haliscomenobacter hydrossis (strain ATCC 27775 / DSM 1100 / LMG 10767 / O) TaxID=760192 RepID=F4KUF4_HALH1|nr:T9SS type A sorting domain-containing protein [Haliscomenobacter hydrossis]AEE51236.1 hypothetical protein Halhy_3378 [Haliscomenobacter hydrossis DSM 1100]